MKNSKIEKSKTIKISQEEKDRWKPILQDTWEYIAYDILVASGGKCRRSDVIEVVCDANRPCENYGYHGEVMTSEEYKVLLQWYDSPSFKKWIRDEVFKSSVYVI